MEMDGTASRVVADSRDESGTGAQPGTGNLVWMSPVQLMLPTLVWVSIQKCKKKSVFTQTTHIAPRGAKKEEGFGGVILKSERPSGALFTNSGPPFFTVESKIEVLSPLGTSFH